MPSGYVERVFKGKFCGTYEIAKFANVSKAQIAHWLKTDWFPKPVDEPAMGRVWDYEVVVAALEAKGYPKEVDEDGNKVKEKRYDLNAVVPIEQT